MTTAVSDTGRAFLATLLAQQALTVSLHTGDPGADLSANELPTVGANRNYARIAVAASALNPSGSNVSNPAAVDGFTPGSAEDQAVVTYLGYRFGATVYGRVQLAQSWTLRNGVAFQIPIGVIALTFPAP